MSGADLQTFERNTAGNLSPLPMDRYLYDRLRRTAIALLRHERFDHPFQAEDLLHEAAIRILKSRETIAFLDADHVRKVFINCMRRILIDHARAADTEKRGGKWERASSPETLLCSECPNIAAVAVSQALGRLSTIDRRWARVVELHVYSSFSFAEIAKVLALSTRTVRRHWNAGCYFLRRYMAAPA